jgi:hypothetical protein
MNQRLVLHYFKMSAGQRLTEAQYYLASALSAGNAGRLLRQKDRSGSSLSGNLVRHLLSHGEDVAANSALGAHYIKLPAYETQCNSAWRKLRSADQRFTPRQQAYTLGLAARSGFETNSQIRFEIGDCFRIVTI